MWLSLYGAFTSSNNHAWSLLQKQKDRPACLQVMS